MRCSEQTTDGKMPLIAWTIEADMIIPAWRTDRRSVVRSFAPHRTSPGRLTWRPSSSGSILLAAPADPRSGGPAPTH